MEHISHAEQHRRYPEGTIVVAENGEHLGTLRTGYPNFFLVHQEDDLEVPVHAIASYDSERLYLTVDREALSRVDAEEDGTALPA